MSRPCIGWYPLTPGLFVYSCRVSVLWPWLCFVFCSLSMPLPPPHLAATEVAGSVIAGPVTGTLLDVGGVKPKGCINLRLKTRPPPGGGVHAAFV